MTLLEELDFAAENPADMRKLRRGARIALEEAMRVQCGAAVAVVGGGTASVELQDVVNVERLERLLAELSAGDGS